MRLLTFGQIKTKTKLTTRKIDGEYYRKSTLFTKGKCDSVYPLLRVLTKIEGEE
jgi:hypothetical protein